MQFIRGSGGSNRIAAARTTGGAHYRRRALAAALAAALVGIILVKMGLIHVHRASDADFKRS